MSFKDFRNTLWTNLYQTLHSAWYTVTKQELLAIPVITIITISIVKVLEQRSMAPGRTWYDPSSRTLRRLQKVKHSKESNMKTSFISEGSVPINRCVSHSGLPARNQLSLC